MGSVEAPNPIFAGAPRCRGNPGAAPGHPNITELVVGSFFANLRRQVVGSSNLPGVSAAKFFT